MAASATRPAFICASCARFIRSRVPQPAAVSRALSSSTSRKANTGVAALEDRSQVPRWKQTPPAMKMAFRVRPVPNQPTWVVNDDQELLDQVLDSFIGDAAGRSVKGRDVLPEEVKWLAVTHKSFEQGARGYNDRLAFLGKRILDLQTSKLLLKAPSMPIQKVTESVNGEARIGPLQTHPALQSIDNITAHAKQAILAPKRLSALGKAHKLNKVLRWKPRQIENLAHSGIEGVMAHTVCAIIGAIAMQKGGYVANEVARKRILKPLGLDFEHNVS